jgi:hypothetical protein
MSKMNAKITHTNVIALWASQYPEVERWLSHLQQKRGSAFLLYRFCQWAHKTPPELIALKEKDATVNPPPNIVEKLLDDFCGRDLADFRKSGKYGTAIQVKSFFKWSYRSLERASGAVAWEKVKPYNALSKEGLRKLYSRALNPRDRALIPFVTCTGLAKETLSNLLWSHLESDWETKEFPCIKIDSELLKGHGKGKYKGVRQVTFLTPEAKRELLNYKQWIEDKLGRKLTPQDHIWLGTYKPCEPLSYAMLGNTIVTLSDNAKVPFSLHDGRRWVTTALEQIGISSNWARKIRGRKVRGEEAPYSQPAIEQLREKFREAVPLLEFTTEVSTVSKEVEERLKALEKFKGGLTPEQVEAAKRAGILMRKTKNVSASKDETCTDGKHCGEGEDDFKQITETELLQYLKDGWQIAYKLTDGQVIVKRE